MAGGGFGEAALMSAVIGGGVSAIKGEDPLKGALMGGLLGGAGNLSGIGNLLSPAAPVVAEGALVSSLVNPAIESTLASGLSTTALPALNPTFANAALGAEELIKNAGPGIQLAGDLTPEILQQTAAENLIPQALQAQQDKLVTSALSYPPPVYPPVPSQGGLGSLMNKLGNLSMQEKLLYGGTAALAAPAVMKMFKGKEELGGEEEYDGPLKKFKYDPSRYTPLEITPPTPYQPVYKDYRNYASGGLADLGRYSDYARGGRMLKGPGDGMSDDIPATIAGRQPARLANEEFVIPADVVSHLGNGSSEAGAKQLYKMMDRVRHARTGKKKQGKQINPEKYLA
jgi:hypothetical protein